MIRIKLKGDVMNLRLMFEVLGPLRLSFPKSRDFNCSFDVKYVFIAQFISKLQANTSKIDNLIFHDFVKKTRQNLAS